MSSIHLLRHGQASFDGDDYDVLSPLGIEQARCYGQYLATERIQFDRVFVGPRKRQIDTAEHLREAAARAGHTLPEPDSLAELDEFPAIAIFQAAYQQVCGDEPVLAEKLRSSDTAAQRQAYRDMFNIVALRWANDELDIGELERFASFCQRVDRALDRIREAQGRSERALVVTSGGPISVSVRRCLALDDHNTMRIALVVANASVTELRWRDEEITLFGFNHTHHLDRDKITYR